MSEVTLHDEAGFSYDTFRNSVPAAHAALLALGEAVDEAGLDKRLSEIVKIRVSQINGCAFCVGFHLDTARRLGIADPILDAIAVWRDSPVFSARERTALAWAEHLTRMADGAAPSHSAEPPSALLSRDETLLLTVAIAAINAWNLIAGGLHFSPLAQRAA
ncbi:carboxymuconolactone decarboxylase family protein [Methylobacterium pseudosasicola]|uniref:Alkylhydroperoxidase AhpD family core domain-containing protein n=1 Tax=Methylobacterium pseudosasicola TaxID=582667 RepID=A0A1I4FA47_9HYPH|nr:carboxymuconolactone decarboxylase family protein [Methylobacterium pseudosasicola]SFL14754.1 alkylhydroperoxidase AhpD family core domain-containing protein [Methylobacterium pseudosasicola]